MVRIGSLGIQPSEFTKLGLIIFTSKYLSNNQKEIKNIKKGVLPILEYSLLVFGLIMLEPDFWYRSSYSYDYNSIIIYKWSKNEFLY